MRALVLIEWEIVKPTAWIRVVERSVYPVLGAALLSTVAFGSRYCMYDIVQSALGWLAGCVRSKPWLMVASCPNGTDKSEGLERSLEFEGDMES